MAFGTLDLQLMLGKEWQIENSYKVTSVNQQDFASDLPASCVGLRKQAKYMNVPGMGNTYVPPIGWTVYDVRKPMGYSGTPQYDEDLIWVSPAEMAWSINKCANSRSVGVEKGVFIFKKKTAKTGVIVAIAGAALIGYLLFS